MTTRVTLTRSLGWLVLFSLATPFVMAQEAQVDRTELPLKGPWYPPITTLDARDAKAPPVFEVKAPQGAPNVVVILLDDLGFGGTSAFGGVIDTPNFDRLARRGLLYNQFHTTALCSPTRQALITGRNHHSCNQAKITEVATAFPGATGMLPRRRRYRRRDAAAQWLQHGSVRQAPRNGGVGDQPIGAIHTMAELHRFR